MSGFTLIGMVIAIVIVVLALLVGIFKGFRKVGKGVFYWFIVGGAFIAANILLAEKNPLKKLLGGYANVVWLVILLAACVLIGLVVLGIMKLLLRPVENDVKGYRSMYDDDFEMEAKEFFAEQRRENAYRHRRNFIDEEKESIGICSRIFGGLLCVFSLLVVVAAVVGGVLAVLKTSFLQRTFLEDFFAIELVDVVMKYVSLYVFDFIAVGVIFALVLLGYRRGFLGALRMLFKRFGIIAAIVLGFVLPFLKGFASIEFVDNLLNKCADVVRGFAPAFAGVGGQIMFGAIFAIFLVVLAIIINVILKALVRSVEDSTVLCVVDGVFGCIAYLALGVLVIALLGFLLYLLNKFGVFYPNVLFKDGTLVGEIYNVVENIANGFFVK